MTQVTPSTGSALPESTDVLVLGSGIAGICAAIEAAEAGASVVLVEGASGLGGASRESGGEVYLGGGTSTQNAVGMQDTVSDMKAFLKAALGPDADEAKIDVYCEGSTEHHDWLLAHGVQFKQELWDTPTWMPGTDAGLMWMGERAQPFASVAVPAARGHRPPKPFFAGKVIMKALTAAAEQAGVQIFTDCKAKDVRRADAESGGAVEGVVIKNFSTEVEVRAKAVVIATGGFVDNDRMLAQWAPHQVHLGKVTDGHSDGSGIEMGLRIGAAVRRMHQTETALPMIPLLAARGFMVDGSGRRFMNEDRYPGLYSHAAVHHRPAPTWIIVDESIIESTPESELWSVQPSHAAETIEELAADCGLPPHALRETLEKYNEDALNGNDTEFGKADEFLEPLRSPFGAYPTGNGMREGMMGSESEPQGFTLGGLVTDLDSRVLDWQGAPIAGLFAAGRATHGMHGQGYISGTSLGDGSFFGRIAGRGAAAQAGHRAG